MVRKIKMIETTVVTYEPTQDDAYEGIETLEGKAEYDIGLLKAYDIMMSDLGEPEYSYAYEIVEEEDEEVPS